MPFPRSRMNQFFGLAGFSGLLVLACSSRANTSHGPTMSPTATGADANASPPRADGAAAPSNMPVDATPRADATPADVAARADAGPSPDQAPRTDAATADAARATVDAAGPDASSPAIGLAARPANPRCLAPARPTNTPTDPFPKTLRATGCFDPVDARKVAPGAIPYSLNAPLWSDGSEKERFMAIPDGSKIRVGSDGDFDLPKGTVLIKNFRLENKLVETRLFVRHSDDKWAGYSYEWNKDGTDADLVPMAGRSKVIGIWDWYYPSRMDCGKCHTQVAGDSLGLEIAQLNRDLDYPGGKRANQLRTLAAIGLFDAPLYAEPEKLPRLEEPFGTEGTLNDRARAYLHGNCAGCHRPMGAMPMGASDFLDLDLRFQKKLTETKACDQKPGRIDFGLRDAARIVAPGLPDNSVMLLRVEALNANRMPPLASSVVDPKGLMLLTDWIKSLKNCTPN